MYTESNSSSQCQYHVSLMRVIYVHNDEVSNYVTHPVLPPTPYPTDIDIDSN